MEQTVADKIFYLAAAGFTAGVFTHSFLREAKAFFFFLLLLAGALLLRSFLERTAGTGEAPTSGARGGGTGALLVVFILSASLGLWRYSFSLKQGGLEQYARQDVVLLGIIADEPDVRETNTRLILMARKERAEGKVLLIAGKEPQFEYGDEVQVEGKLLRPQNFTDKETLREVDYVSHLDARGIAYEMFRPKITLLERGKGNPVVLQLLAFKKAFTQNIGTLLPEPHASLLGGLIVGAKQSLGKELLDDFRIVGVIHIVVLSGYNITIIGVFIEWLLSRLRKNMRLLLAAATMILFAIMVGASATVIRATVMALLVLLARGAGRVYDVTRALLLAGVIMLLHNPRILVFDTSFQLSFLATVGLIYVSPLIEPKTQWVSSRWHLRDIVVATIATQIFVLPFLLYKTGILSLVSLPVNLLILTAVPATMLFGFLAGLTGFLASALAAPFAFLSFALLAYELMVVEWFSKLSFSAVTIRHFPLWLVVFWYGVYAALLVVWRKKKQSTVRESP